MVNNVKAGSPRLGSLLGLSLIYSHVCLLSLSFVSIARATHQGVLDLRSNPPPIYAENLDVTDSAICSRMDHCQSCTSMKGCAWCAETSSCFQDSNDVKCNRGWSNSTCYATCADSIFTSPRGMISLGSTDPPSYYWAGDSCRFTISPYPKDRSKKATSVKLTFEHFDLADGDYVDIYGGGADGLKIYHFTSSTLNLLNTVKAIPTRMNPVIIEFVSARGSPSGTGFRAEYEAVEASTMDIYLISAIIVTAILSCILCSCCCNSFVVFLANQVYRYNQRRAGDRREHLSAEEKNKLPLCTYLGEKESGSRKGQHWTECCICLTDYNEGETVRELPCGHIYHQSCIDTWLEVNTLCPLCKQDVRGSKDKGKGEKGEGTGRNRHGRSLGLGFFEGFVHYPNTFWSGRHRGAEGASQRNSHQQITVQEAELELEVGNVTVGEYIAGGSHSRRTLSQDVDMDGMEVGRTRTTNR